MKPRERIYGGQLSSSCLDIVVMEELFQKFYQTKTRVLILVMVLTAFAIFGFQNLSLNSKDGSSPLFPLLWKTNCSTECSSFRSPGHAGEVSVLNKTENSTDPTLEAEGKEVLDADAAGAEVDSDNETKETDRNPDDDSSLDLRNGMKLKKVKDQYGGFITIERSRDAENNTSVDKVKGSIVDNSSISFASPPVVSYADKDSQVKLNANSSDSFIDVASNISSPHEQMTETLRKSDEKRPLQSDLDTSRCKIAGGSVMKRKKPKMSISEMNQELFRSRGSSCSLVPEWSSKSDQHILDAKAQIVNARPLENDQELYAPVFRNVSIFKKSYELMEKTLKVYVYKEGEKPIFHAPPLTGIYASEGWFMKHMEENRQFVAKDPREAHLFYMPFSSRNLQAQLYIANSHSHKNLIAHLKKYVSTISTKYPFWNRTGGADHFLAGCHDWATHETGQAMGRTIRALCNADVTEGFELGKDVSLPETYVHTEKNPLRDLGGKPPKKRPILAFFAGQMHGYLRPILLQHWENRDPNMKIFGPMPHPPREKRSKNKNRNKAWTYPDYMKNSKYCICPRGYEVNSPRVVEAIFYECIPVIISDNFVPPFFEVLNWEAFSVILPESDVPRLKEILESIPRRKYLKLHEGVRGVQKHFLWHNQPVKYDLFHMILHSVWFNRVHQLRVS